MRKELRSPAETTHTDGKGVGQLVQSPQAELRLDDLYQRRTIPNQQGRAFELQQLLLLEFGKQAAHGFACGPDNLRNFFVGQRKLDRRGTIVLRRLRGP